MKKLVFLFLVIFSGVVAGELEVDENNVVKCNQKDADAGMSYAIIACAGKETEKTDAQLNREYTQLIADIKKESASDATKKLAHLRAVQRAWIKYRDTQCNYHEDGGRMEGLRFNSCLDRVTAKRIQELKETRCAEGEFTSPCYLYQ